MNFNLISKKDQIRELLNFLKHSRIKTVKELLFSSVQYYWIYHQKQYPFTKKYSLSRERERKREQLSNIIRNKHLPALFSSPSPFPSIRSLSQRSEPEGAIDLWKLAFRKSALSSLDLARFISDPPCKKLVRVCIDHYHDLRQCWPPTCTHRTLINAPDFGLEIVARSL